MITMDLIITLLIYTLFIVIILVGISSLVIGIKIARYPSKYYKELQHRLKYRREAFGLWAARLTYDEAEAMYHSQPPPYYGNMIGDEWESDIKDKYR